jgi:hypothetical protein
VRRFFLSELCKDTVAVLEEPTFEEYVHALTLVAAGGEARSALIRRFASIFDHWVLESERAGPAGVQAFLAAADAAGLPGLAVVPTSRGGFAAPRPYLYIADDEQLAAHFRSARWARFVHSDLTQPGVQRAAQLSELLALPLVSQAVRRENIPYFPRADAMHPLGRVVAAVLPLIQRWIFWSRPSCYSSAALVVERILPLFKTLLCDRVDQTLQLGDEDRTLPQPCAAALDGPCFYVARGAAEDFHAVFEELARALLGGAGDADLATFAALLAHTVSAKGNTEVLMERAGLWQLFPCCQQARDSLARTPDPPRMLPVNPWLIPPDCDIPDTLEEAGPDMKLSRPEEETEKEETGKLNLVDPKLILPMSAKATAQPATQARQDMQLWPVRHMVKETNVISHDVLTQRSCDVRVPGQGRLSEQGPCAGYEPYHPDHHDSLLEIPGLDIAAAAALVRSASGGDNALAVPLTHTMAGLT